MTTALDAMVSYITRRPGTSFAELEQVAADHGITAKGDYCLEPFPNGIVWSGISAELAELLMQLIDDDRVATKPLTPMEAFLIYSCDGKMLTLPVAQRPPRDRTKGYAKPRWLAYTFAPA